MILQTQKLSISLLSFLVAFIFSFPVLAKEKADRHSEILSQYWYDEKELAQLPDPKPVLSPQCRGVYFKPPNLNEAELAQADNSGNSDEQTISADRAVYSAEGVSVFEGHVIVSQGEQTISGDRLRYHHQSNQLDIEGNVQIEKDGLLIASETATYDNEKEESELNDASFLIFENALNGHAERISISKTETEVHKNSITTCPPGKENWQLKSKELYLDQEKGWGHAKHASLHIAKVPVLYTPYFTFPLDERRKTGFLYPTIGSDSVNGVDIATPYYINIAPNYDATLTPRILSKRGEQIGSEFRYLNITGEGSISGDYLGQDKLNPNYSERKQAQWLHQKQFSEKWYSDIDYTYVSDSDYFDDLDSFSSNTNLGYLDRQGSLVYIDSQSYFSILVQDFQVFDNIADVDQPYRLAPQIASGHEFQFKALPASINFDAQLSRFERDLDANTIGNAAVTSGELITGNRFVLQPELSAEFSSAGWFIRPSAKLHHRQYQLEDYLAVGQDEEQEHNVGIYSLDSGLIFERPLSLSQNEYTQTLEPRLKFVKVPYVDQSDAPNFDSSLLSFNEDRLFRERRYAGHDLVGDTEQVTFGVGSIIYNDSGIEKVRLNIGQTAYLQDRRIQLDPAEDTQEKLSSVYGSAKYRLIPNWKLSQKVQWDSEDNLLEQVATGIHYKNTTRNLFNLEFRYRPASLGAAQKETRTSFMWPLGNRWTALSFWNYDLEQESTIELASGLEYENCCVIVRALNQKWLRKVSSTNTYESANKQSLEIQLKGLGSLNNQISNYLESKIDGFNE